MATGEVTGKTAEEVAEMREQYAGEEKWGHPFEDHYCLVEIPHQPDDYDGPPRYCAKYQTLSEQNGTMVCKFHGGSGTLTDPDDAPAMTHGMNATREHLVEDFDEKDQALYDWIVEAYPEKYDLNLEENPSLTYDLHRLAAEIVRAERGRGFLIQEGEVNETPVRNEEGRVVTDEAGEVVTEKSEHYLSQMMNRQDKKITKLEKELGITRKEQLKQDSADDVVDVMKGFEKIGASLINRDEKEYDPQNQPWKSEDEDNDE
jgi:hypothetical protein